VAIKLGSMPTSDIPGLRASNFIMPTESPADVARSKS
jgi:hypothetical protein